MTRGDTTDSSVVLLQLEGSQLILRFFLSTRDDKADSSVVLPPTRGGTYDSSIVLFQQEETQLILL